MEEESLVGIDESHSEPTGSEIESLLHRQRPTYVKFRIGREAQQSSKWTGFVLKVFKVCFCSLGLWGHQAWNYIPRVLLGIVCIFQVVYVSYVNVLHKCQDVKYSDLTEKEEQALRHGNNIGNIDMIIFTVASSSSFLVFIGCFMAAKRKQSALVSPSKSMILKDINKRDIFLLFLAHMIITLLMSSSLVLFYKLLSDTWAKVGVHLPQDLSCKRFLATAAAAYYILYWVSLNTCHIFAVSSLALGTFAQDALRLIRELQNDGTLDDIIRIHEDLCTVVFSTVSAYSVWFVLHWFTYAAGVLVFIVGLYIEVDVILKDKLNAVHSGVLLSFLLYFFLLPCVCAARITSHCAGIYEKINHTTSDDWKEGHPFRDRHNIALFISYAKDRRCGFKVGGITFNSSQAWISFFFGFAALLYQFFKY